MILSTLMLLRTGSVVIHRHPRGFNDHRPGDGAEPVVGLLRAVSVVGN